MSKNDTQNESVNTRLYALEEEVRALKAEIAGARRAQPSLNMGIQAALDKAIEASEATVKKLEEMRVNYASATSVTTLQTELSSLRQSVVDGLASKASITELNKKGGE